MNTLVIFLLLGFAYGRSYVRYLPKVRYETINLFDTNEVMEVNSAEYSNNNINQNKYQESHVLPSSKKGISVYIATPTNIDGYKYRNIGYGRGKVRTTSNSNNKDTDTDNTDSYKNSKYKNGYKDSLVSASSKNENDKKPNNVREYEYQNTYRRGKLHARNRYAKNSYRNRNKYGRTQPTVSKFRPRIQYVNQQHSNVRPSTYEVNLNGKDLGQHMLKSLGHNSHRRKTRRNFGSPNVRKNKHDNIYRHETRSRITYTPIVYQKKNYYNQVSYEPIPQFHSSRQHLSYVPTVDSTFETRKNYYQKL